MDQRRRDQWQQTQEAASLPFREERIIGGQLGLLPRAELGGREQAVRSSSDILSSARGSSPPLPTLGPLKLHVLVPCGRVKDPTWKAA